MDCLAALAGDLPANLALTNAAQVRALSPTAAGQHLPVHLQGVVVLGNKRDSNQVLGDDTANIYLEGINDALTPFQAGDVLEVSGFTDPGKFAPVVKVIGAKKVGVGPVPAPKPVSFSELLTGRLDAQSVEISGVVRRSERAPRNLDQWQLSLNTADGGQLSVGLSKAQGEALSVDSEIRLSGVCFYQFTKTRQTMNPVLSIPTGQPVRVLKPAPVNPYDLPTRAISSLMQFSSEDLFTHRVKVRGVVTYVESASSFWIRDAEKGLHIKGRFQEVPSVGAEVEVLGFLAPGDYSPVLEDALFRKQGQTQLSVALPLTDPHQALDHDADLIQIEGVIQTFQLTVEGCRLMLQSGPTRFQALLHMSVYETAPENWLPGSRVRLKGICSVKASPRFGSFTGTVEPQSFQVLLRSRQDLVVLKSPPWWTPEHIIELLISAVGLLLAMLAAGFWVSRRRLQQQSLERIKAEAEFAAVWNERNRIARELHDTLAQGLGAISMQLEVAKRQLPEAAAASRESLEIARSLARASLTEVRNSIWNMRSQVLETGDLASALADVLRTLTDGTTTQGEFRVRGTIRRLAPASENDLLRIGQEAMTNAIKHAQARNLDVTLEFEERKLRLTVADDGRGFDVAHPPASEGGLGLVGMRERATQLNGEFTVTSEPGEGTMIVFAVPLPG